VKPLTRWALRVQPGASVTGVSPSTAGDAELCGARFVGGDIPFLPDDVHMLRGKAEHRVIDIVQNHGLPGYSHGPGWITPARNLLVAVRDLLEFELQDDWERVVSAARARPATFWFDGLALRLRRLYERGELRGTSEPAEALVRGTRATGRRSSDDDYLGTLDAVLQGHRPGASEVGVICEGVRGRADRIEKIGQTVRITDLKTGKTSPQAEFQLGLYGLAVVDRAQQLGCNVGIELRVDAADGIAHVPFVAEAVRERWLRLMTALERPYATPGEHCVRCAVRHACEKYDDQAARSASARSRGSFDLSGTVRSCGEADGLGMIRIERDSGGQRLVSLGRLRPGWLHRPDGTRLAPGDRVAFFGLRPAPGTARPAFSGDTVNFVELPRDAERPEKMEAIAWALAGYVFETGKSTL
jgi:hypothetical protein